MNTILHGVLLVRGQILRHLEGIPIIFRDRFKNLAHLINVQCFISDFLTRFILRHHNWHRLVRLLPLSINISFLSPNPCLRGANVQFLWKSQGGFVEIWLLEWKNLGHRQFKNLLIYGVRTLLTKLLEPQLLYLPQLFVLAVSFVSCQYSYGLTGVNLPLFHFFFQNS